MKAIELFYEEGLINEHLLPRKVTIEPASKIAIWGPKFCGKFSLVQSFLQKFNKKELLFIDFDDLRSQEITLQELNHFITQKGIKRVVLYGYKNHPLPTTKNIIIISHHNLKLPGFQHYHLKNLDFEEYLLFEKRSNIKVAFNNFLKNGNSPAMKDIKEYKKDKFFQNLLYLSFKEDLPLFKEIAAYQGYRASIYFLFNRVKERHKISKDRFYALFEKWQKDRYLYALPKFGAPKAAKKLFFYDFTIKSRLFSQKEFPKSFENMVFLEIIDKEPFYLDPLGFYLPQDEKIVLAIPFGNEVRIQTKIDQVLKKGKIAVKKIEVVTIATRFSYEIQNIKCEILPFYEWAMVKD